jgi:hypothetical protein
MISTMSMEVEGKNTGVCTENLIRVDDTIHGEILKLGIDIGETSVAKYMARRRGPPSQGWKAFLNNHADGIATMDMFVVPTISFRLLYGLLIMGHGRRQILWLGVTSHPTAEWIANQLTEACGLEQAPRYLIRDRDGAYGEVFVRRLRSIAIRDRLSMKKDAPVPRAVERAGHINCRPVLGGLHHQYLRI